MSEINLIAARYVEALFELAEERGLHDSVKKDFLTLKSVLAQSAPLRAWLGSPVVTRPQAEKSITALLSTLKACDLTQEFFTLLARQRRLALAPIAIEAYLAKLAQSRGELTAQVTSATKLSDGELSALSGTLAKATGKKVELQTQENPALIGGVQVQIGSQMLDNTIAGKLARLRLALKAA